MKLLKIYVYLNILNYLHGKSSTMVGIPVENSSPHGGCIFRFIERFVHVIPVKVAKFIGGPATVCRFNRSPLKLNSYYTLTNLL